MLQEFKMIGGGLATIAKNKYCTDTFGKRFPKLVFNPGLDAPSKILFACRHFLVHSETQFYRGKVYVLVGGSYCTYKVDCLIPELEERIVQAYPEHYSLFLLHLSIGLNFISRNRVLDNFVMSYSIIEYGDFFLFSCGVLEHKSLFSEWDKKLVSFHFFNINASRLLHCQSLDVYVSLIIGKRTIFEDFFGTSMPYFVEVFKYFKKFGMYIMEESFVKHNFLFSSNDDDCTSDSCKSLLLAMLLRILYREHSLSGVSSSDIRFQKCIDSLGFCYSQLEENLPLFVYAAIFAANNKSYEGWIAELPSDSGCNLFSRIISGRPRKPINITTRRSYSKRLFSPYMLDRYLGALKQSNLCTIDYLSICKGYDSNRMAITRHIYRNPELKRYFVSGGNLHNSITPSGYKQFGYENKLNLFSSSNSVHSGECVALDQYYSHGNICVTRNTCSEKVDMLITTPSGDFISAWQFKNKEQFSSIEHFMHDLSTLSTHYSNVDTAFGILDCFVVVDIRLLEPHIKELIWTTLESNPAPKNVLVWDTSIGVGDHNVCSQTFYDDLALGNPVIYYMNKEHIRGCEVVRASTCTDDYKLLILEPDNDKVVESIPIIRSDTPIAYSIIEPVSKFVVFLDFYLVSLSLFQPILFIFFLEGLRSIYNGFVKKRIMREYYLCLLIPLFLRKLPLLLVLLPLFIWSLPFAYYFFFM